MREVVIASATRTPIGSFGGSLKDFSAVDLGVVAAKEAIKRAGIAATDVDDVIIGNVYGAGLGQNMARQIAIKSGVPVETPCMAINILCGSGLRSVSMAAQMVALGDAEVVLCGGSESMSGAPYIFPKARYGQKMGDGQMIDTLIKDGLQDAFQDYHMGITAENLAQKYSFSREAQDAYAATSQNRAEAAQKSGKFVEEIVPVEIPQRKGDPLLFEQDEYVKSGVTAEGIAKLRPAFQKEGTVTAANASGINDGAAMLIVMSKDRAEQLGVTPLATIKAHHTAGVDPSVMGYGPVPATEKALEKAGWTIADLDLVEANEAFAVQALSVMVGLKLNPDITNVNGGAIALGHPIGASGARVLVTLLYEMKRRDAKKGLATACVGGGMGVSLLVER